MKLKLFYLSMFTVCMFSFKSHAQTDIDANGRSYSQIFDSLSTGLILNRIPYGTLYDRVYPWSGLTEWSMGDTTSVPHLFQSWFDAEQSVIDSLLRLHVYDTMRSAIQQQLFQMKLPIVVINFQFAYIDSMAESDGRTSVINGILTDNGLASPYLTKQVSIAGLPIDKIYSNKNYLLVFGSPTILNNTSVVIDSVILDNLTEGSQKRLSSGAPQAIQFTLTGSNVLKLTVKLNNGSWYVTHQIITVQDINSSTGGNANRLLSPTGPNCVPTNDLIESDIPFQGYTETQATTSFADYHIYYHTQSPTSTDCERVLRKPIIILDGFDPKNGRQYYDIYGNYLKNNDNNTLIGHDLRDKGYDVIILNFPVLGSSIQGQSGVSSLVIPADVKVNGGTQTISAFGRDGGADYIERNAFLLVKLIQEINATLVANGSTEKIVIVGPSMGGQISRYALAYMEKKNADGIPNMNHNTRLWVSFDSPHNGANIPLTFQKTLLFYGLVGQNVDAMDAYRSQIRSNAARQLLIEQVDGLNSTSNFHQTYYNNLQNNGLPNSNGYPQNLRKVSLVNGGGNGNQILGDGAEALNGVGRMTFLNLKVFELVNNFMPSPNVNARILRSGIFIKRIVRYIWENTFLTNNNNRGSMDAVPGGTFNTNYIIFTQFKDALEKDKIKQTWTTISTQHSFIPTISALGFKNPVFNWNNRVDNRNLICTNEIYFDNYYVPQTNQEHIYLNTSNVNWLTREIEDIVPCVTVCPGVSIQGVSSFCTSPSPMYTINNLPAGANVLWQTNPLSIATPNTPNAQQTSLNRYSDGSISLQATITNACNPTPPVTKSIYVGGPLQINNVTTEYTMVHCMVVRYRWTVIGATGATAYRWFSQNITQGTPPQLFWTSTGNQASSQSDGSCDQILITVEATNACSITPQAYSFMSDYCPPYMDEGCSYGGRSILVSPNPTMSAAQIEIIDQTTTQANSSQPKQIHQIRLINKVGVLKKTIIGNLTNKMTVDLSTLPTDVYSLMLFDGNRWFTQKIIKL